MLLIDKTQSSQSLIVTVSEYQLQYGNVYKLIAFNKAENRSYSLILPANSSPQKERYDEFTFPTSSIATWKEGFYVYNIVETNGATDFQDLEIGLLKVVGKVVEPFISNIDDSVSDEYIAYDNI